MRIWEPMLSETDREVIRRAGYGQSRGLGEKPAVMVIDAQYNYCGDNRPILDQIEAWPSGAGQSAWQACDQIIRVVQCARGQRIPIIYTRHTQQNLRFDGFAAKTKRDPSNYLEGSKGVQIIKALSPTEDDIIVDKQYSSAFYGTPLQSYLTKLGVDTLIVTGGTTSGCVRAFCVDAVSRNFNVALLEDAVFDRISASHKIALLDLWMKYCDVIPTQAGLEYLKAL
jgi:nicotinamidase-related amidase